MRSVHNELKLEDGKRKLMEVKTDELHQVSKFYAKTTDVIMMNKMFRGSKIVLVISESNKTLAKSSSSS